MVGVDVKSLTWGATGERAWGQNVLTGAAAERRDVVMAEELAIIHPLAFSQPERTMDLNSDNKAATARVFVKLHNDMQRAARKGGFSLINHNVQPMLLEDAAFHKFSEMSTIGPWIDRLGKLQWDYVTAAGFKGARNVRNGNLGGAARKAELIESGGYILNDKGKWCIQGYHDLGNLRKAELIESDGYILNDKGKWCIQGYQDLGNLGGAARKAELIESDGYILNDKGKWCIQGYHDQGNSREAEKIESGGYILKDKGEWCIQGYQDLGNLGAAARVKKYAADALDEHHTHICISALCQRGASVKWENGYPVVVHCCYDPQQSGLAGQPPRQKKGLKLHVCKKCHRTAQECKGGAGCRATCSNTNLKSCQHLH